MTWAAANLERLAAFDIKLRDFCRRAGASVRGSFFFRRSNHGGDYPQEKYVYGALEAGSFWERWQSVARK